MKREDVKEGMRIRTTKQYDDWPEGSFGVITGLGIFVRVKLDNISRELHYEPHELEPAEREAQKLNRELKRVRV